MMIPHIPNTDIYFLSKILSFLPHYFQINTIYYQIYLY